MSIFHTTFYLHNGHCVKLGDVLVSPSTHDVIVKLHKKENKYIVQVISNPATIFPLGEFVQSWHGLEVKENLNLYFEN